MINASGDFKDASMRDEAMATLVDIYPTLLKRWEVLGTPLAKQTVVAEPAMDVDVLAVSQ